MITDLLPQIRAMGVSCFPGATEAELAQLSAELGFTLPDDLSTLYRDHNGMGERLSSEDEEEDDLTAGWFFRFMSVQEVIQTYHSFQDREVREPRRPGR